MKWYYLISIFILLPFNDAKIYKGIFHRFVAVEKSRLTSKNLASLGSARTDLECQLMSASSDNTEGKAYCFHENQCFVDTLSGLQVGKEKAVELADPIKCFSIPDANGGIEYIFLSFVLVTNTK